MLICIEKSRIVDIEQMLMDSFNIDFMQIRDWRFILLNMKRIDLILILLRIQNVEQVEYLYCYMIREQVDYLFN